MMREPPERLEVTAILDPSPAYAGTSHEDATARAMGFRAALMPGVIVYGHAMRLAVRGGASIGSRAAMPGSASAGRSTTATRSSSSAVLWCETATACLPPSP